MNWESIIAPGLSALIMGIVMYYYREGANKQNLERSKGLLELKMNKLNQITGYLCFAMALVFVGVAFYFQEGYFICSIVALMIGGLGQLCLMGYKNHRVQFNDEKIIVQNWKGKSEQIRWTEIEDLKMNSILGYLKIKTKTKTITVYQYLIGMTRFTEKLEEKTNWTTTWVGYVLKVQKKTVTTNQRNTMKEKIDDTFAEGQVWHYQTRRGEENSTIQVVKIDQYENDTFIHISVNGLQINNPTIRGGKSSTIGHLPFSKKAIQQSVTQLATNLVVPSDFADGYQHWKTEFDHGRAGVFTISIADAVNYVEEGMNSQ